ncbi:MULTISPECIES: YueI family protein [Vagococcus]|uniref:YueI family protein n=1 Tax=Vagococcus TaxID=2737 RepID=UPI002FCAC419
MSSKNVQDYLDNALYGTPEIKPDEKRKYLGTFRERVVFVMTLSEAEQTSFKQFCLDKFKEYPNGTLLINANIPMAIQNRIMKIAQQVNIGFRMVDTDISTVSKEEIVIVFAVDTAINIDDISVKKDQIKQKIASSQNDSNTDKKKTGFLQRLFQ